MTGPGRAMLRWFKSSHLSEDLRPVSEACGEVALLMVETLPESPELTAGLRKLLEAKDCFVRAAIDARAVPDEL